MKLNASRTDFLAELQLVSRATAVRSAVQTLAGVLISADADGVKLAATDTEIGIQSHADATVEGEGSILVPGRLLVDILRVLEGDEVTLERRADRSEIAVTSGSANFVVRGLPVEDFPRLPSLPEAGAIKVPADTFADTIQRVAKAASRDETRPVLTGVMVSVGAEGLRMVATDSYRLSMRETPMTSADGDSFEANVPARALQELGRIAGDAEVDEIAASAHDNQIVFGIGRVTLSSRMIDGQFPNYQQLLPESYEHEVTVGRTEFLGVVRRISLMAQRNAPLRLRFEKGMVTMSAVTPDVGEASEQLPVNYDGEPMEIGFNPQFLQDGFESADADELALKLISPLRPGLVESSGGDEEGRFIYLIMPVRLNV
jgi:DNA polymerase-3 subunit beta